MSCTGGLPSMPSERICESTFLYMGLVSGILHPRVFFNASRSVLRKHRDLPDAKLKEANAADPSMLPVYCEIGDIHTALGEHARAILEDERRGND